MNNYRIHRIDSKNIVIQRKAGEYGQRWQTISYHGNSANSLISGLFELIMAQHTPNEEKLLKSLKNIRLELVSGTKEMKKMLREYCEE